MARPDPCEYVHSYYKVPARVGNLVRVRANGTFGIITGGSNHVHVRLAGERAKGRYHPGGPRVPRPQGQRASGPGRGGGCPMTPGPRTDTRKMPPDEHNRLRTKPALAAAEHVPPRADPRIEAAFSRAYVAEGEAAELRDQVAELQEALSLYGDHHDDCALVQHYKGGGDTPDEPACDCGFDAAMAGPAYVRRCRVCGCTDDDCAQCVERTGAPCSWVEEDLCSACASPAAEARP